MSISSGEIFYGPVSISSKQIKPENVIVPVRVVGHVYHARLKPNAESPMGHSVLVKETEMSSNNSVAVEIARREDRLLREELNPEGIGPTCYGLIETIVADGKRILSLVMDDIPGENLEFVMPLVSQWNPERRQQFAKTLGINIASELEKMQGKKRVHRDIKPANIMVSMHDVEAQLIDFGLNVSMQEYPTLDKDIKAYGTPQYISPEQARWDTDSVTVDETTDLYALALVLAEIMAGKRSDAYDGKTKYNSVIVNQNIQEYLDIGAATGAIPLDFYAVLQSALFPDQADRYPNAATFRAALEQITI